MIIKQLIYYGLEGESDYSLFCKADDMLIFPTLKIDIFHESKHFLQNDRITLYVNNQVIIKYFNKLFLT